MRLTKLPPMDEHLTPAQLIALRELARRPRALDWSTDSTAEQLVNHGLARIERGATGAVRVEITPAGRHLLATWKATAQVSAGRRVPRMTVAAMQRAGWAVHTGCERCGVIAAVDLDLMAWRFGARTKLTEREDRCLVEGCGGRLDYFH